MSASAPGIGDSKGTRGGCCCGCALAVAAVLLLLTLGATFVGAIVAAAR